MKAIAQNQKTTTSTTAKPQGAAPVQAPEVERPDLAAQLASATRLGHRVQAVSIHHAKDLVAPVQPMAPPNKTGLPDGLKAGLEHYSGMDMSDVKVHYNSAKPAQLQALAYTQGTDIHVGPGQEVHLPHEGWHVVQQMQGRVKPTMQMKGGVNINDATSLENEANVMGDKTFAFVGHRREAMAQRTLQELANNSPRTKQLRSRHEMTDNSRQVIEAVRKNELVDGIIQRTVSSSAVIQCYPSYQTFQDTDLNTYCSAKKLDNHTKGAEWVRLAIEALRVTVRGKPLESDNQPMRSIVGPPWPARDEAAAATPVVVPVRRARLAAYDDPSTSRESRALIEEGLHAGQYPPK